MRLLTATFTTRPVTVSHDPAQSTGSKGQSASGGHGAQRSSDIIDILADVTPSLPALLGDSERVAAAVASICNNVTGPALRAKAFPENIDRAFLELLLRLTKFPQASKVWRKDLTDALNDPRFFSTAVGSAESHWLLLIRQWERTDKNCVSELVSRISAPATAGIMFGVGASSARLDADRKTQLNLRRIAAVVLSAPEDAFVASVKDIIQKLSELTTSTPTSSPSSATRAEVLMVIRALILKLSPVHLAPTWPFIEFELRSALSSVIADSDLYETYNTASTIQACRLLDTLVTLSPDDFQLNEWLFITDTIDAVYRPECWEPVALVDELAEQLGTDESASQATVTTTASHAPQMGFGHTRRPMLDSNLVGCNHKTAKDELVRKHLRPFFSQLSMANFEATYAMDPIDWEACRQSLLKDLFDASTVV